MCNLRFLFILLFLPLVCPADGQNLRQISSREGLSNSAVLSLAQDANGYLWIGTCDGLNRWDGMSMRTYKTSGNLVQEIIPTDDGVLWIRTNYGLDRFDIADKRSEQHAEFPRVYALAARSGKEAFLIHQGTLYYYDAPKRMFEKTDYGETEMHDVRQLYFADSRLWFVTASEISCTEVDYGAKPTFGKRKRLLSEADIRYSVCDGRTLYYIADRVLYALDIATRRTSYLYNLSETIRDRGDVSAVVSDGDDLIVSFEMNGAVRLHAVSESAARYRVLPIPVNCGVFSLLKDRNQEIVWIGTDGSGIYRQTNFAAAIRSVTFDRLPYKITKPVKALFVDKEESLWIGTKNDGIIRIRDIYEAKEFTAANTDRFTAANSPIRKNSIYAFAPSRHNLLWIGGDGAGLNYYSYADGRLHTVGESYEPLSNIHDLRETSDSTLWVATVGQGVYRVRLDWQRSTPTIQRIERVRFNDSLRNQRFFFAVAEESDSVLWFASHGAGAIRYNRTTGSGRAVRFGERSGLAADDVTAIVRDSSGVVWFGTGCGLESYPTGRIAEGDRMNNVIHSVELDSEGHLWLGTNTGIVKYDPRSGSRVVYSHAYGLDVVEFSDEASFRDAGRGVLFFGGVNGFITVNENRFDGAESYRPPLLLSEVSCNGKSGSAAALMRNGVLTIAPNHSMFTLSFAALDYIDGSNYSYSYKLDNDDWNDNGAVTQLTLANLRPGRYSLAVRYHNNITGQNGAELTIPIRVLAPWYNSTVAWLLYIALLLLTGALVSIGCIRRARSKRAQRQAAYEQHQREILHESQLTSLANISNDLSIPLTLIDAPCQQILNYTSADAYVCRQAETIRRNAMKLNDLIYMLNELKIDASARTTDRVVLADVSKLLSGIAQTFERYAETDGIAYNVSIEENLFFPAAKDSLSMIVNILLNNAVKRTSSGSTVALRAAKQDEWLHIEISNVGAGLDARLLAVISDRYRVLDYFEQQGRSGIPFRNELELAVCCNLVMKSGGTIEVRNNGDETVFAVSLPRLEVTQTEEQEPTSGAMTHNYRPELAAMPRYDAPPTAPDKNLPTMLVQNDDAEIRTFIAELFGADYNVVQLRTPDDAAEVLGVTTPDIVICGSQTLTSSMVGFIRRINGDKHAAQIPVVFLSATPRIETDIDSMELGVDMCLSLPFDVRHLQAVVGQLLKKYRSLRDYGQSVFNAFDFTDGRVLHRDDKSFLDKVLDIISNGILDPKLSAQYIADKLGMSQCNLYRRLGLVTEQTPANIIKEYRLRLSCQLLVTTKLSIDEVMYKSGFFNRSTFFRCFTAQYGCTPKIYRQRKIGEVLDDKKSPGEGDSD